MYCKKYEVDLWAWSFCWYSTKFCYLFCISRSNLLSLTGQLSRSNEEYFCSLSQVPGIEPHKPLEFPK